MATRQKTQQDKEALKEMVRAKCRAGEMRAGDRLPTLRELTTHYSLSMPTVAGALQELVAEGVLYFLPRVGTFVGPEQRAAGGTFVFVTPYPLSNNVHMVFAHRAFEATIAARGGSCLTLEREQVAQLQARGALPVLAGLFEFGDDKELLGASAMDELKIHAPRVVYLEGESSAPTSCDSVNFDHHDGGGQATRHLLSRGHRRIAFLGLHTPTDGYFWSRQREEGWREALCEAKVNPDALEFLPQQFMPEWGGQGIASRQASQALVSALRRGEVEAVVAVNCVAAHQLFAALSEDELPHESWPAVVAFDDEQEQDAHLVSTLRLPWDELGAQAAHLLCARASGQKSGPGEKHLVKMSLMPRLTCQSDWSLSKGMVALMTPAPSTKVRKKTLVAQEIVTA